MKKSSWTTFILTLLMSVCACCFVSSESFASSVYAANQITQDCYYLLKESETPYLSTQAIGKIQGAGDFVVGTENVVLTATANSNYQLVGWQVTYNNQGDRTEYYGTDGLTNDAKTIKLTPSGVVAEEEKIEAVLTFIEFNGHYASGTFELSRVFEDVTILPVFDHIYYQVVINSLVHVSAHENYVNVGADVLYYNSSETISNITTYTDAYFLIGGNYYYYGEVKFDGDEYYKVHSTLEATPREQKVEYSKGAFRINDNATIDFDVDISSDFKESKNIDLKTVVVNFGDSELELVKDDGTAENNCYTYEKDDYLRTSSYNIEFKITNSVDYLNIVTLGYHNLYVVDLNILIDGSNAHEKHSEIFGNTALTANSVISNISIYNFYSKTNANNLQFLVKSATDNEAKSLGVVAIPTISKEVNYETYRYYEFATLDGATATSKYYSSISENFTITIDYTSVKYAVSFKLAEYVEDDQGNGQLYDMIGNSKDPVMVKRGETLNLTALSIEDVQNIGYEFVGFAEGFAGEITATTSYTVPQETPVGKEILICFQKIEYELIFTNYNTKKNGATYPINNITFTKTGNQKTEAEILSSANLSTKYDEGLGIFKPYALSMKIKLGESLLITHVVNSGFNILGYNLSDIAGDYFTNHSFELNAEFISSNSISDKITIYVHEDTIYYTLTYYIDRAHDNKSGLDVIMANIDVDTAKGVVTKYTLVADGEYYEISEANGNTDAEVAKIVVSQLELNDVVVLKSNPFIRNKQMQDEYSYSFKYFTENGLSTLSYDTVENAGETYYNHNETIERSRIIKVVYSMATSTVIVSLEEEFARLPYFTYSYNFTQDELIVESDNNIFVVDEGFIQIEIVEASIAFGYEFVGYKLNGSQTIIKVDGFVFEQAVDDGSNEIVLVFNHIVYNFYFEQYGDLINGDLVDFGGNNYISLTVDNRSVAFEKPEGYYVSNIRFGQGLYEGYSSIYKENNDYRLNADFINYLLDFERIQFIFLVSNLGVANQDGIIEVNVRIDYEIFVYSVSVEYGLVQPKGDEYDALLRYPEVNLTYVYNNSPHTLTSTIDANNVITFDQVPYGSVATIRALSGAPTGLAVSGWRYANGDPILANNASDYILLGEIFDDWTVQYKFLYISYGLKINKLDEIQGKGEPVVELNGTPADPNLIQATLYDRIKISSNAIRNNGYKFKSINYLKPTHVKYEYDPQSWGTEYSKLYFVNDHKRVLNSSSEYDISKEYYYVEEISVTDPDYFIEEAFHVNNYIFTDNTIMFEIEYELLQFTITNSIKTNNLAVLLGKVGNAGYKIEIDQNDLLSFALSAHDTVTGNIRPLEADSTVTCNDQVTIEVLINNQALNKTDGTIYDLSKGLALSSTVKIAGVSFGIDRVQIGKYSLRFYVRQFMSNIVGDDIEVQYLPTLKTKQVYATTVVENSPTFYQNIHLIINPAEKYGYGNDSFYSNTNSFISTNLAFLTMADVIASFSSENYKNNFKISGVNIYCDGNLIVQNDYANYGISVDENWIVSARIMCDELRIVFKVQPVITYNGGPNFSKTFKCDNDGNAVGQTLSVGDGSSFDIQIASEFVTKGLIQIQYQSITSGEVNSDVTYCDSYNVIINFIQSPDYDWLSDVTISETITLTIVPKTIYLTYDESKVVKTSQEYNGSSDWAVQSLFSLLQFYDRGNVRINYLDVLSDNKLVLENGLAFITADGENRTSRANEEVYYSVCFYNFKLNGSTFNKNFRLSNDKLLIKDLVQIKRRALNLLGVKSYVVGKVFDGGDRAELSTTEYAEIRNVVVGDRVTLNPDKLDLKFKNYSVGANKEVLIISQNALEGEDASNYCVADMTVGGLTIYPYSVSVEVEGFGEVSVVNIRGLTEKDKIDLIPLNAVLLVEPILVESNEYVNIYNDISKYLRGNNQFVVGYKLSMMVDGAKTTVNKNLYLTVPSAKYLTGVYFLTGEQTDKLNYFLTDNKILIDLQQMEVDLDLLIITQKRIFLKPWQIVLIVVLSVCVIAAVVLTFIIIRKRKIEEYSVHDKI